MSVRFGVAGTAYWAREVHVRGLKARSDVELVGIWGRNGEATRTLQTRRNPMLRHVREMLAAVDAVSIPVAPEAQPALAGTAAEAGKHLLLEKPLGLSVALARRSWRLFQGQRCLGRVLHAPFCSDHRALD